MNHPGAGINSFQMSARMAWAHPTAVVLAAPRNVNGTDGYCCFLCIFEQQENLVSSQRVFRVCVFRSIVQCIVKVGEAN